MAASVEPEHRAESAVMEPGELNGELRLTHPSKAVQGENPLPLSLSTWEEGTLRLLHFNWSVDEFGYSRDTFNAETCAISPKIYIARDLASGAIKEL